MPGKSPGAVAKAAASAFVEVRNMVGGGPHRVATVCQETEILGRGMPRDLGVVLQVRTEVDCGRYIRQRTWLR